MTAVLMQRENELVSPWKANTLVTIRETTILRRPGDHSAYRAKAGEDLLYVGCRTIDGHMYRIFSVDGVEYMLHAWYAASVIDIPQL